MLRLVVSIKPVVPDDELMLITRRGIVNRQSVNGIRVIGRNTQGVRLINLDPKDLVVDVACVVSEEALEEVAEAVAGDGDLEAVSGGAVEIVGEGEE